MVKTVYGFCLQVFGSISSFWNMKRILGRYLDVPQFFPTNKSSHLAKFSTLCLKLAIQKGSYTLQSYEWSQENWSGIFEKLILRVNYYSPEFISADDRSPSKEAQISTWIAAAILLCGWTTPLHIFNGPNLVKKKLWSVYFGYLSYIIAPLTWNRSQGQTAKPTISSFQAWIVCLFESFHENMSKNYVHFVRKNF